MSKARCTLIIPTYNRPEQLRHQLCFCSQLYRNFVIRVADGSQGDVIEINRATVLDCDHPDIRWTHFKEVHLWQRAVALLGECDTPYAMLCADDDFLMPDGALAAIEFLDAHPDYASAQGITLGLPRAAVGSPVVWNLNSLVGRLDADLPVERMVHHLAMYSHTCYAIHRTAVLKDGLRLASSPPFSMGTTCLGELAQSIHTVLAGKAVWLDVPWLCRGPSTSRWPAAREIMNPDFSSCLAIIRDMVVSHSGAEPEDLVRRMFDQAFSTYFVKGRFSPTAAEYDFWPWRSSRTTALKPPSLTRGLKSLKGGTGWAQLIVEYPAAARHRSLKWWFRNARSS